MTRYVLSVDGGGIRGIIPAIILAEIQKRLTNFNKSLPEVFDLMAGTSTGGIIVAGLSKKNSQNEFEYSSMDLFQFYKNYGPYIFKPSFFRQEILYWFNGAKYSYKNIEFVLNKYFGEDTMGHASTNILFTSYDIHNNCPFFFKSWKDPNITLKDALRSTTAAPTYFIPKCLKINKKIEF
ncbi:patatin-like phospholipase family protein [Candidatus Cardinium hertigii]|uniref:patatin-like phospholipase family protein n=1 Tax=Candidatus Cardinium hertigii TaxID=247481 RepID=UPI003D7C6F32